MSHGMMKAMVIRHTGAADVFELAERPVAEVTAGKMLVEVKATSVNPIDTMLRATETPWSANLPEILHGDVAGVVIEVADDVTEFQIGDEVYGCAGGIAGNNGALAECILVDARLMAHKPRTLSMKQAAALPLVSITAWEALVEKMQVQAGDKVLIHGATGGVGHVAVQLAKALGAEVSATARSRTIKEAELIAPHHLINADQESVQEYVSRLTANRGFDKVFDTVAKQHIQNSFEAARFNGQVATILPVEDVLQVALKGLSFHSVLMLIPQTQGIELARHGAILRAVAELVDSGKITPLLDQSDFSIKEVAKAHERLESGLAVGKIVLSGF